MKKWIFIALLSLLSIGIASLSFADPFLAVDPMTPEVVEFQVNLSGQLIDVPIANVIKQPSHWLVVDLASIGAGPYNGVTAKANYGVWGWSGDSLPFDFVKPVISEPVGTRLALP